MIRVAVITASDRSFCGEREDKSGPTLEKLIPTIEGTLVEKIILSDDKKELEIEMARLADEKKVDVIFTTGGTGLSPRDNTPDATMEIIDKVVPGIAEAMRYFSLSKTPNAMLSRAICGVRKQTLIINFPGSPKAIEENFEVIAPAIVHAIEIIKGKVVDCHPEDA